VLALIEQGMKVYTAIHKRVYRAFKSEFAKLYRLNRLYLTDMQRYRVGDEWREVTPEDYRLGGGVEPIADPTMVTDMQKLGRAQLLLSLAGDPILSKKEVYTRLFDAANLDRIEELFAPPSPAELMMLQIALAEKQAELGRMRAQEQQYQTQALLNLAMARAKVSEPEVVWIEKQMDLLRLHIEATNTMVKAADVEARSHGAVDTSEAKNAAGRNARTEISPAARIPAAGDGGSGIPALAPLPDNGGVPAVPQGPGAIVPTGGNGPLGIGPSGPAGNPGPPSGQ
jgi:chaperonin GroES